MRWLPISCQLAPRRNVGGDLKHRSHLSRSMAIRGVSGVTMLLVSVGWSLAAPPPIEHKDWCFDNRDHDCSGAICSCCTNDGCWICDRETWEDCEWDDAYGRALEGRA